MEENIRVKIVNKSNNPLPEYHTTDSAGMDLHAFLPAYLILSPMQRLLIPTGLYIELPTGFEAQIRPRSGLALKHGITVLNSPGTVDADYRGEIKVLLINLGQEDFRISSGDRVAQMIVSEHSKVRWELSDMLNETKRGDGGYGSTSS